MQGSSAGLSRREKHLAFSGVLTSLFLSSLNLTVVGTALPRIIAELQGFHLYAWAFAGFSLALTASLPIYGRLSDIHGRKKILLLGIVIFTLSSVLSGLAQNMPQLIAFRVAQGLGGGALIGMSWSALGDIFSARERGRYQGYMGLVLGVSSVIGPIAGGLITDSLGWRWVFFVNIPAALVAFAMTWRYLPWGSPRNDSKLDLPGSLLLTASLVILLVSLTLGGVQFRWNSPQIILLVVAFLALVTLFWWWQHRAAEPIMEPALFRHRTFNIVNAAGFLTGIGMYGAVIYLPLYVQGVLAGSAAASAMALTPLMLGIVVGSMVAGAQVSRTGNYKAYIYAGLCLMLIGFYLASTMGPSTPAWQTVTYMVILGIGMGPTNPLYILVIQNALPADRLGTVTAVHQFFRQIGGTAGVTLFGAVITARITRNIEGGLASATHNLPPATVADLSNPNLLTNPEALARLQQSLAPLVGAAELDIFFGSLREALGSGISTVFTVGLVTTAGALLVARLLPQQELDERGQQSVIGSAQSGGEQTAVSVRRELQGVETKSSPDGRERQGATEGA